MELRDITADAWALWRILRLEALTVAPEAFGSRLDEWAAAPETRWRARLSGPTQRDVMAFDGEAPVGMVSGWLLDDGTSAELTSLYVSPTIRGAGVGAALIADVATWARARGRTRLQLDVKRTNPAVALYLRTGFTIVPAATVAADEQRMACAL